jgi:protease IV
MGGFSVCGMKSFFASFFATLAALLVFSFGVVVLLLVIIGAVAALGDKPVVVTPGSYLVVDLTTRIQDTPDQREGLDELLQALVRQGGKRIQLRQLTRAIEAASADDAIAGLFLHGELDAGGAGYAQLREVRAAIDAFRQTGKPVKAYFNYATTGTYYLASAANHVTIDPYGAILMPGLASQPMFFAKAFERFGVGVQVTRVGKYKSAVEPYTRTEMSDENRAQIQKLLNDIWSDLVASIEQSRSLAKNGMQSAIDAEAILRAPAALEAKLVDRVAYWDVVLEELKADTGRAGSKETFKQIDVKRYAKLVSGDGLTARRRGDTKVSPTRDRIGIVYAEGVIMDGDGQDDGTVYGDKVARDLRRLRMDDNVKAVVLRVNSPGGSASASEVILREVRLTREKKPVIVSMGHLAASGGYWISSYADRIFAESTTITGSIGVFGILFNVQDLANEKLGVTFDTVKTGRFADLGSIVRPKTDEELALIQKMVDWIYDEFTHKVSEARKLDLVTVQEIAQGRVWSGSEALKLGLVDEIGGLSAAVRFAAEQANLGERFRVVEVPRKKQFAEALNEALEGKRREQAVGGPFGALLQQAHGQLSTLNQFNDPKSIYARMPFDLALN